MKPNMKRKGLYALVCALMGLTFGMLTSCSDDLDVQQSYPFTVETMPVPTRIVKGETVDHSLFPAGRRRQVAHGRRDGTAAQRPLSPGQGGVPPLLHLRV